jgi:hypothetical protein
MELNSLVWNAIECGKPRTLKNVFARIASLRGSLNSAVQHVARTGMTSTETPGQREGSGGVEASCVWGVGVDCPLEDPPVTPHPSPSPSPHPCFPQRLL